MVLEYFIIRRLRLIAKIAFSFVMSVRPSAALAGRFYVKFDIGDFNENLSRRPKFGSNQAKIFIVAGDNKSP